MSVELQLLWINVVKEIEGDDFFVYFKLQSKDPDFDGRQQAIVVQDMKGDVYKYPKVVMATPFEDSGSTHKFGDGYDHACSEYEDNGSSNDLVYYFKPAEVCLADISLCNSDFDTKLFVLSGVDDWDGEVAGCNDDSCSYQSRLLIELQANVSYGIVIDGYNGKVGDYHIKLVCQEGEIAGQFPPLKWYEPIGASAAALAEIGPILQDENIPITIDVLGRQDRLIEPASAEGAGGYMYNMSEWTDCSLPCGGGEQFKLLPCIDSDSGTLVNPELCADNELPYGTEKRGCNLMDCEVWSTYQSRWSNCSVPCGEGFQEKVVLCQSSYGRLAPKGQCRNLTDAVSFLRSCEGQCNSSLLQYSPWSSCSATCGGGMQSRSTTCISQNAQCTVEEEFQRCNTASCTSYIWMVSDWQKCSSECSGGTMSRSISCYSLTSNSVVDAQMCDSQQRPQDTKRCNSQPCNFCNKNDCSTHGTCVNNKCVCKDGWSGLNCEIPQVCRGGVDKANNCCTTIVNSEGECCPQNSNLDRQGNCCESGNLDVCGVCDGNGKVVDIRGQCTAGWLDVGGFACDSGIIDECGICDGDHSSCATNVSITMQWKNVEFASVDPTFLNNWVDLKKNIAFELSDILGVDTRLIDPFNIELEVSAMPMSIIQQSAQRSDQTVEIRSINNNTQEIVSQMMQNHRGLLQTPDFNVRFRVNSRAESSKAQTNAVLTVGQIEYILQQQGKEDSNSSILVSDVVSIEKVGVCGNGICEIGEQPLQYPDQFFNTTHREQGVCPEDCIVRKVCKAPQQNGIPCGNFGICLSSSGVCDCYKGYSGVDCGECDDGYYRDGETCKVITQTVVQAPTPEVEGEVIQSVNTSAVPQQPRSIQIEEGDTTNTTNKTIVTTTKTESALPWALPVILVCALVIIFGVAIFIFSRLRKNNYQNNGDKDSVISDVTLSSNQTGQGPELNLPQMQIYSERTPNRILNSVERVLHSGSRGQQSPQLRSQTMTNVSWIQEDRSSRQTSPEGSKGRSLGNSREDSFASSRGLSSFKNVEQEVVSLDSEEALALNLHVNDGDTSQQQTPRNNNINNNKNNYNNNINNNNFSERIDEYTDYFPSLPPSNSNFPMQSAPQTKFLTQEMQKSVNKLHQGATKSDELPTKLSNQNPPLKTGDISPRPFSFKKKTFK